MFLTKIQEIFLGNISWNAVICALKSRAPLANLGL